MSQVIRLGTESMRLMTLCGTKGKWGKVWRIKFQGMSLLQQFYIYFLHLLFWNAPIFSSYFMGCNIFYYFKHTIHSFMNLSPVSFIASYSFEDFFFVYFVCVCYHLLEICPGLMILGCQIILESKKLILNFAYLEGDLLIVGTN